MGGAGVMMGNIHRNKKRTHAEMRHSGSTPYGWQDSYTHTLTSELTPGGSSQATDGQCSMSVLYVPQCGLIKTQRRRATLAVSGKCAPSSDAWHAALLSVLYLGCKKNYIPGFNSFGCLWTLKATMGSPQSQEPLWKNKQMCWFYWEFYRFLGSFWKRWEECWPVVLESHMTWFVQ